MLISLSCSIVVSSAHRQHENGDSMHMVLSTAKKSNFVDWTYSSESFGDRSPQLSVSTGEREHDAHNQEVPF